MARGDELVLDLRRIDSPLRVNAAEGTVTAGAGVTIAEVQQALGEVGLWLPLELGSWQSATVGGVVATNAGGTRVLRHGHVRTLLGGLEAVLGSGEIVSRLDGWRKDNNGPDLAGLLCGSEGTLGVITAATFRVVPRPTGGVLLGVLFPDWEGLVVAAVAARNCERIQRLRFPEQFFAISWPSNCRFWNDARHQPHRAGWRGVPYVTQPLVSQHLKTLRAAGLVVAERDGREVRDRLSDEHVAHIAGDALLHAQESSG